MVADARGVLGKGLRRAYEGPAKVSRRTSAWATRVLVTSVERRQRPRANPEYRPHLFFGWAARLRSLVAVLNKPWGYRATYRSEHPPSGSRWSPQRAFEAHEIVDAFTDLERQLASPDGDTLSSAPARPVPRARQTPL